MKHPGDELHAFLDGELDATRRAGVETHLRDCAACRARLEELREQQLELHPSPVPDPGAVYWNDFAARVQARLPARRPAGMARWGSWMAGWLFTGERFAWGRAFSAAAVCTVLVYVGMRGFRAVPPHGALDSTARPPSAEKAPSELAAPELASKGEAAGGNLPQAPLPQRSLGAPEPLAAPPPRAPRLESPAPADEPRVPQSTGEAPSAAGAPVVAQKPAPDAEPTLAARPGADDARAKLQVRSPDAARDDRTADGRTTQQSEASRTTARLDLEGLAGKHRAVAPPAAGFTTSVRGMSEAPAVQPPAGDSVVTVEAWLGMDARFWPQRSTPGLRPTLVQIADGLARHPEDAQATARMRAYFEWLAATSPSDSERTRWEERLRHQPPH